MSRALWTQSSLTQRVSFFCSLRKEGSTRVPRHQRLCFPNLISFLTKVSQLRRGMAYQILPLSRSFLPDGFFFTSALFCWGPVPRRSYRETPRASQRASPEVHTREDLAVLWRVRMTS